MRGSGGRIPDCPWLRATRGDSVIVVKIVEKKAAMAHECMCMTDHVHIVCLFALSL